MTAHTHRTLVPGCYRCELNEDEMRAATNTSCWYCGDDPDGSGSTASMGWCEACDERKTWKAEIDRLREALALAVGELSTYGPYTIYAPDQLLAQFLADKEQQ